MERAERRQITIMFCDLVDSVDLSTRLDPEDLRDVIGAYHQTCAQSAERHGGYIANYLGDGVLVYFGYPSAHEDDAERAARAGLEIVEAVTRLDASNDRTLDIDLKARVGIATGLVVVGDVIRGAVAERDAIAGEAVNLAARLQTLARPNTVLASATTRHLAAERFEYVDLGVMEVKGFAKPVPVYQVIGEREISRLTARSAALTPFVNRVTEISFLKERWARAVQFSGQVVIITGDAGIGKSRIAAETIVHICRGDPTVGPPLLFHCSPRHINVPLYPVMKELERLALINRSDPVQDNIRRLKALLTVDDDPFDRAIPLIADLLDLEQEDEHRTLDLGPTVKRNQTIGALIGWIAQVARSRPLIVVFEDMQWIDPTSRLFLNKLVDLASETRVLVIITTRTDGVGAEGSLRPISQAVGDKSRSEHVSVCDVRELGRAEATQLATAAAEGRPIRAEQLAAVLTKSDGIPLYLEELIKAVTNSLDFSSAQQDREPTDLVPNSLRGALMAQLDQLGSGKELAQQASVIGQDFSLGLLARIVGKAVEELIPDLHRLVESKILLRARRGHDVYRFRHALVRDIAYRSLLKRYRRQIHVRVARELAGPATDRGDVTDDLIAQHYSQGEAYTEAIVFWRRGATSAIARSAHEEALAMLDAALADLGRLSGPDWHVVELALVMAQAIALRSLRGYSAPEVEERLLKARELCTICGDSENRFNVEWGLFQCTIVKRNVSEAQQLAAGLFEHARRHPNLPLVDAYLANGMAALNAGEFEAARTFLEKGVSLSRPEVDPPHFFAHGQNPGLFCLSYLARTRCFLGDLDAGREIIGRCVAIAANRSRDRAHIYGYANALIHAVRVANLCGDLEAEKTFAIETQELARSNHYAYYEALSHCHLGWVAGIQDDVSEGIARLLEGIAALERTSTSLGLPGFYILLAQLYLRAGRWEEADRTLTLAAGAAGHAMWDSDVERLRGDVFAFRAEANLVAAEKSYRLGLKIAQAQNSGLLAFKAGFGLARLLAAQHRGQEGYDILRACLERIDGEFGTREVRNAQSLLKDLAGFGT